MDYLDPETRTRHAFLLMAGYVLIGVAILIATVILLQVAYGFGLGKNGKVIQRGLIFLSSHPAGAQIHLDGEEGKLIKDSTNTRLFLPAGNYHVQLTRDGYRPWQRTINLEGGKVLHFDYPFLIPQTLTTKTVHSYDGAPALATQSPDHRWLVVSAPSNLSGFEVYDLKNPAKPVSSTFTLPANLLTTATSGQSWQVIEWADDNRHLLLQHLYDGKSEFILLDRDQPGLSVNLNQTLAASPAKITLINRKYDQYHLFNASDNTLQTASLRAPTPVTRLTHVFNYQDYGDNVLLYATDTNAPPGKVEINILNGTQTYTIREVPAGTSYLLDLTKYSGTMYVAIGASSDNRVYVYKDPITQLSQKSKPVAVAVQVLRVQQPTFLSFSPNAQFIVAENSDQIGVYDALADRGYLYKQTATLDVPQAHATWMDGNRLAYVSQGKLLIVDYDGTNQQSLMPMNAGYIPFFSGNYKYAFVLAQNPTTAKLDLTQTALVTAADL